MRSRIAGPTARVTTSTGRSDWATAGWRSSISSDAAISRCGQRGPLRLLIYNGEIYNFRELRVELEAHGHLFRSRNRHRSHRSMRYAEWGEDCVMRFNGMFAFALWDRDRQAAAAGAGSLRHQAALLLRIATRRFVFASEIKALLLHPGVRAAPRSPGGRSSSTSPSRTSSRTARCLPASGCCPRHRDGIRQKSGPRIRRYWDYQFREPQRRRRSPGGRRS